MQMKYKCFSKFTREVTIDSVNLRSSYLLADSSCPRGDCGPWRSNPIPLEGPLHCLCTPTTHLVSLKSCIGIQKSWHFPNIL